MVRLCQRWLLLQGLLLLAAGSASGEAVDAAAVARLLARPVVARADVTADVAALVEGAIAPVAVPVDALDLLRWREARREELRAFVFNGIEEWRDRPLGFTSKGVLYQDADVVVEAGCFDAVPGLTAPLWIYRPARATTRSPAVLSFIGHGKRGARDNDEVARAVELARRGVVAVVVEWPGAGLLRDEKDTLNHRYQTALDLKGVHGAGVFLTLALRALDVTAALDAVDADRIGVAGLSGGGWQALWVAALDDRPVMINVVAGFAAARERVRTIRDTGDWEQVPADFFGRFDYGDLLLLVAPRPLLLTANVDDDCCFRPDATLPPLLALAAPAWGAFGERVWTHTNVDPGTHNFGADNRAAFFAFVARHLQERPLTRDTAEAPRPQALTTTALAFALPQPVTFQRLAQRLKTPTSTTLAQALRVPPAKLTSKEVWRERVGGVDVRGVVVSGTGVPRCGVVVFGGGSDGVVFVADKVGAIAGAVASAVAAGRVVAVVDPVFFGAHDEQSWRFALLLQGVGQRALGIQLAQLSAAAHIVGGAPELIGQGPRAGFLAELVARGAVDGFGKASGKAATSLAALQAGKLQPKYAPELFVFGLGNVRELATPAP